MSRVGFEKQSVGAGIGASTNTCITFHSSPPQEERFLFNSIINEMVRTHNVICVHNERAYITKDFVCPSRIPSFTCTPLQLSRLQPICPYRVVHFQIEHRRVVMSTLLSTIEKRSYCGRSQRSLCLLISSQVSNIWHAHVHARSGRPCTRNEFSIPNG